MPFRRPEETGYGYVMERRRPAIRVGQREKADHSDGDVPRVLLRSVPVVMPKDLTGIDFSTGEHPTRQ
ncbi:hypothetical protein ACFV97_28035 [Streptomyces sp. NPDC059913]|uniref:hypothetical protein n=1 Tax=Streptomyces sp. NPDC059913 TaxID=3346999 RepID=UPI00366503A6